MRLGNADDARVASEQLGTEHRFVIAQLTDTVGASVTDTAGQAYTSTVGAASSVSVSTTSSATAGRSGGRGRSWTGLGALTPPAVSVHGERSSSVGVSEAVSSTGGITEATAWGAQTARAVGANNSLARTSQRSREFLVEPHQLQQLPPSALIVSYASAAGRRVVLADANPGIGGLPSATLRARDEAGPATAGGRAGQATGATRTAGAAGEPVLAGPPSGFGSPGPTPSRPVAWAGPMPPPSRDPAEAPLSWRDDNDDPALGAGSSRGPRPWRRRQS
jgi:hypothetical protein